MGQICDVIRLTYAYATLKLYTIRATTTTTLHTTTTTTTTTAQQELTRR